MKKISILCALVLLGITISGCANSKKQSCESQGGTLITKNGNGIETCYFQTNDADKPCTDNKECEVYCVAENKTATSGKCQAYKPFLGCNYVLENGKTKGMLCE
ncbi:MAG: hypothetical protein AAB815_03415 [Patescibacteria group bacterium]